jgi:hypothetical protein
LPHHGYHSNHVVSNHVVSNHVVIVVTRAEVGRGGAFVVGEAHFVTALMGPQHGLAEAEDLVGPATDY